MTYCADDDCERPVVGRSDARYCSSACRQRAYRQRKRLLAPYGGDAELAMRDVLDRLNQIMGVTDSTHG